MTIRRRPFSPSVRSLLGEASPVSRVVPDPGEPGDPVELEDYQLEDYQTPLGAILVGYDRDRDDYVAESGRLGEPQRGRTELDAVEKVLDLLHDWPASRFPLS